MTTGGGAALPGAGASMITRGRRVGTGTPGGSGATGGTGATGGASSSSTITGGGGATGATGCGATGICTSASAQNHPPGGQLDLALGGSASAGNDKLIAAANTTWVKQRRIGRLLVRR